METDVAVLGGAITGLTTALLLKRDGARVVVSCGLRRRSSSCLAFSDCDPGEPEIKAMAMSRMSGW